MFTYGKQIKSLSLMAMVIAAAGCGGGQSSAPSANAAMHTSRAGEAVLTYFGQPKPQLTSSAGNVTVVGQAGATFSTVILEPAPELDSTYLAIGRGYSGEGGIYTVSYPEGANQLLYQNAYQAAYPSISAYGTVAFWDETTDNLRSIRQDGTGLTSIAFSGISGAAWPRYATDGTNRLTFSSSSGLYVGPGTGGTATLVQSGTAANGQAWNPSGTQIVFSAHVGTAFNTDLFTTPVGGGAFTDVTPTLLRNAGEFFEPSWSPDGISLAAAFELSGSATTEIVHFNINEPGSYSIVTATANSEVEPVFSPDGSKLAVYRMSNGGQTPGIYVEDAMGVNPSLLAPDPSNAMNTGEGGMSWSPFLPKESVVSATASTFYHQAASGFLLTQNGDQFGSFVAFTASTPADAGIQAPSTDSGYAPLAFTLTADAITSIGYINNYFNPGTTITLTSTPSVVVTIDAVTGQVDLVAPASVAKPSATKNADGTLTYRASFKALYDGKGSNLAPNGASSLTVDPKSGKLVRMIAIPLKSY